MLPKLTPTSPLIILWVIETLHDRSKFLFRDVNQKEVKLLWSGTNKTHLFKCVWMCVRIGFASNKIEDNLSN